MKRNGATSNKPSMTLNEWDCRNFALIVFCKILISWIGDSGFFFFLSILYCIVLILTLSIFLWRERPENLVKYEKDYLKLQYTAVYPEVEKKKEKKKKKKDKANTAQSTAKEY